jgi:glutamate N-acetyltransferase/amino-acid N-acetyltransferase
VGGDGTRVAAGDVAVCSTGLIGERLPIDALLAGVDAAAPAARGERGRRRGARDHDDRLGPEAGAWPVGAGFPRRRDGQGRGMLAPGLATMLVVLTTDAVVPAERLDAVLRRATSTTFDRVDSDGCMSTNDTVLLLASGAAGVEPDDEAPARRGRVGPAPTWPGSWSTTPRVDQEHRGDRHPRATARTR